MKAPIWSSQVSMERQCVIITAHRDTTGHPVMRCRLLRLSVSRQPVFWLASLPSDLEEVISLLCCSCALCYTDWLLPLNLLLSRCWTQVATLQQRGLADSMIELRAAQSGIACSQETLGEIGFKGVQAVAGHM
ncbi:hypothetical protein EYF80_014213 [Liparis tanakae]|uniref:Uncharacterized protein n=1 Tax=Liparis tanakae TaxID=230148 RepID=A0A4Z2ICA2_9TELE|nr:hypothetical protein EYF80_014213 [Liparis tanakae]